MTIVYLFNLSAYHSPLRTKDSKSINLSGPYTYFLIIFEMMYYCIKDKANLTDIFEVHLYFLELRNRKRLGTWNRKKFHTETRISSKNCKTDKNF